jgi:hypothetical protein
VASSAEIPRRQEPAQLSQLVSITYKAIEKLTKYFHPLRNGMVCREIGKIEEDR